MGAFAEKNTFADLVLVLLFGGLGWVLQRLGWPRPPLILGLVLGPLAENRLFLSTDNYGIAWLSRPGVMVIACLIVCGAMYPLLKRRRGGQRVAGDVPDAVCLAGARPARVNWAILFNLLIIAGLLLALVKSRRIWNF